MRTKRLIFTAMALLCCTSLSACGKSAKQLNNIGIEYYNDSEYKKAADAFSQAVDKDKEGRAEYYVNLGKAYLELGDYKNAQASFMSALDKESDNEEANSGLGVVYYFSGDYSDALDAFGRIVDNAGKDYDDIELEALQYYASLQSYYGDDAGAIDSYTILIRKNYNVAQQYFLRGSIYAGQRMENEAVLDYEEALKLYGDNYEVYYNIYTNLLEAGFTQRAESYLRRALNVECADNLLKGKTYYILKDYENAQKYLSKASNEGEKEAEFYLAMTYEKLGNDEEARAMYEAYIKDNPSDGRVYNQYGMYYLNKGDYDSALGYFSSGLATGSSEAKRELMFNQACCYEYLHQYSMAYAKFEEYLKEYPDDAAAKHEYEFLSTR